jgi:hypothetical protein
VLVPTESNFLINPVSPEFRNLRVVRRFKFTFDERLRGRGRVSYSDDATLHTLRDSGEVPAPSDGTGEAFRLGGFAVQPYLWAHRSIGAINGTLGLRIWHAYARDARKVLLTTSRGDDESYFNGAALIDTDHLIYAWHNTSVSWNPGGESAARIARDHIRFVEHPHVFDESYFLANHYDLWRNNDELDLRT